MNRPRKTCRGCGTTKPLTAFNTHPRRRDGHLNYCRVVCTSGAGSVAYTERQAATRQDAPTTPPLSTRPRRLQVLPPLPPTQAARHLYRQNA